MVNDLEKQFQNEEFLLYRLPAVARHASHICALRYAADFDMSVPEWRLMAQLGRFGNISAKEISDKILMDQVAISRAVKRCTKRGFIREVADQRDMRRKRLTFTAAGRAFYKQFVPQACQLACEMESGLRSSEVKTLKRLLKKLDRHFFMMMSQLPDAKQRSKRS